MFRSTTEHQKLALEICKGDFDSQYRKADDVKDDLKWCRDNNKKETWIHPPGIDTELFCDASDFAWEGVFETKPTEGYGVKLKRIII